jgi:hypothetical protein
MSQGLIALLLALIALSQASILIIEEGTAWEEDWRQLSIELPPSYFDNDGNQHFDRPIWLRREGDNIEVFPVLGSLLCPEDSVQSVAARLGGEWVCVDIDDPRLPPAEVSGRSASRKAARATEGRVDPPTCFENMAPAVWVSEGVWECGDPEALIQSVTNPERPECFDTDLVVYNEVQDWFECKPLRLIEFASTISTDDYRWQTPSTCRHIGSLASSGRVRSGAYNNFRWSNYVFAAATELLARDQTSPPETINNGGATWVAYTISTTFVQITGFPPFETFNFFPLWPGASIAYMTQLEALAPGSLITGTTLTFSPTIISFNPNGVNSVIPVGAEFRYDATNSNNGYAIVSFAEEITIDAGNYPVIQISERVSDWYVGRSSDYDPNLILVMTMWLQYISPSGF